MKYRLISNIWSTVVTDWQGIDDEPTTGSNNLVKSGGVADSINQLKIRGEEDWLRFNYFTIDCTVNSEQFWKEFWEQVNVFVKLTKEGVLQIKKNIKISDLAFKLQIIQNRNKKAKNGTF